MIRNFIILSVLIGLGAAYTHYADRTLPAPETKIAGDNKIQNKAPAFTFKTLDGKTQTLEDFTGKVVILNFWASWCAPCVIEFPQMIDLAKKTANDSVLIFMSVDESVADIEKFLKKQKGYDAANIYMAHDADKSIAQKLFQTYKLPETYIMTPDLMIAEKIVGADVVWNAPDMIAKIKSYKN